MVKFKKRVGRVDIRSRAIVASRFLLLPETGVTTGAVAFSQNISSRRALVILEYALARGWVHCIRAKWRNNAFSYRWLVTDEEQDRLAGKVTSEDTAKATALCAAYMWGKDETV